MGRRGYGIVGITVGLLIGGAGVAAARGPFQEVIVEAVRSVVQVEGTVGIEGPVAVNGTVAVEEPVEVTGEVTATTDTTPPDITQVGSLVLDRGGFDRGFFAQVAYVTSVTVETNAPGDDCPIGVRLFGDDGEVAMRLAFDKANTISLPVPIRVNQFNAGTITDIGTATVGTDSCADYALVSISGYLAP